MAFNNRVGYPNGWTHPHFRPRVEGGRPLEGRYLACGLFDGSVKTWEVANRADVSNFQSGAPVTHICWLEPAEQLAVASEASVHVWDVVARKTVRSFVSNDSICGIVYSRKLSKLAILTTSEAESVISLVGSKTRSHKVPQQISCFAFSQLTKELVCGMTAPGLGLFSVPACKRRKFDHPATITSVSVLPNGTAVANVTGSGIQLLSLDKRHTPPRQPTTSILTVHPFDEGKIIATTPTNRDHTTLLESATMSTLLTIPVRTDTITTDRLPIICASLKHRIAFRLAGGFLEMWRFGDKSPAWAKFISTWVGVGGISPSGSRLVVMDEHGSRTLIWVWNTGSGECEAEKCVGLPWPTHPLEIGFESEDEFISHHDSYRVPFGISPAEQDPHGHSHSVIRREQLPLAERPQRYYDVDDAREWVVCPSKRICWIPPGYIGSGDDGYWWAGDMLIMFGQDKVLRNLTFQKPS